MKTCLWWAQGNEELGKESGSERVHRAAVSAKSRAELWAGSCESWRLNRFGCSVTASNETVKARILQIDCNLHTLFAQACLLLLSGCLLGTFLTTF